MHQLTARATLLVIGLALVGGPAAPAAAEGPILVTVFDDPAPDGSCAGGGDCSLREAMLLANNTPGTGSVVQLAAGTYQLTLGPGGNDDTASGDLDAFQQITVQGAGPDQTVIDVVVADRAFDAHGVPLVLVDLAVSGGGQVDQGGAVRAAGSTLDLTRVALLGNVAERGGAVYGRVGQEVTLTDTVVEGNVAFDGGGMSIVGASSTLAVSGGVLRDNSTSGRGGAIEADAAARSKPTRRSP